MKTVNKNTFGLILILCGVDLLHLSRRYAKSNLVVF
jgi:hypothetical protein